VPSGWYKSGEEKKETVVNLSSEFGFGQNICPLIYFFVQKFKITFLTHILFPFLSLFSRAKEQEEKERQEAAQLLEDGEGVERRDGAGGPWKPVQSQVSVGPPIIPEPGK